MRSRFRIEEQPGGWEKVDRVRLAIHRDGAGPRAVLIGAIRGLIRPASVAIYRNDDGVAREDSIPLFADATARRLDRLGIGYRLLRDSDIAGDGLAGMSIAVLPLNPVLSDDCARSLQTFVARGGRIIACYSLPKPLPDLLGVDEVGSIKGPAMLDSFTCSFDDGAMLTVKQQSWWSRKVRVRAGTAVRALWINAAGQRTEIPAVTRNEAGFFVAHVLTMVDEAGKDELLLAMIGELWPGVWEQLYHERVQQLHETQAAVAMEAARAGVDAGGGRELAETHRLALKSVEQGERAAGRSDFRVAASAMASARAQYQRVLGLMQIPKPGEFRAAWCHDPVGIPGMTWRQTLGTLKDKGIDAVIVNMLWGGTAAFPGGPLPVAEEYRGRDLLAECLSEAADAGVAVHVWKVNWYLWSNDPAERRARLRSEGRLQVDGRGGPVDWLCPSHPLNRQLEHDAMVDIARRYDVAGLHFDYIRYPGPEGCYCDGCRERFEATAALRVQRWPADVIDGPHRQAYLQFRRDSISRLVEGVSRDARAARPGVRISAAVFADWATSRDSMGQDWRRWIERGWLDFVCPMQYTESVASFEGQTMETVAWSQASSAGFPVMTGIGATLGLTPEGTLLQVLAARRRGASGFVLFNLSRDLLAHLDLLSLGVTRRHEGE